MSGISEGTKKASSKISEYQKFVELHKQFIMELEMEGGDTTQLRKDVVELQNKILQLKLQRGFRIKK